MVDYFLLSHFDGLGDQRNWLVIPIIQFLLLIKKTNV